MELYTVCTDTVAQLPQVLLQKHLPQRCARAETFRREEDRLRCLGAGLLLRAVSALLVPGGGLTAALLPRSSIISRACASVEIRSLPLPTVRRRAFCSRISGKPIYSRTRNDSERREVRGLPALKLFIVRINDKIARFEYMATYNQFVGICQNMFEQPYYLFTNVKMVSNNNINYN